MNYNPIQQIGQEQIKPIPQVQSGINQYASMPQVQSQYTQPTNPIYQYPNGTIYSAKPSAETLQQAQANTPTSPFEKEPVRVYINYPAGYMGPNYVSNNSNTQMPAQQGTQAPASTSIVEDANKKKKRIVKITDDYIKSLENYLRSPNKEHRMIGIKELIARFEEDDSRYDDKALNALMNIALQDQSSKVRNLALALANSGKAMGDENTAKILNNLTSSEANFGQEAQLANNAMLKMSAETEEVEDKTPDKRNSITYKL